MPAESNSAGHQKKKDDPIRLGSVLLEQMWNLKGTTGIARGSSNSVSVLCGRAVFLPPKQWTQVLLPYKMSVVGGVSVFCGLSRKGLFAGLAITKGGQIKVNVWNTTSETICLMPKTVLVNITGAKVEVKRMGEPETLSINQVIIDEFWREEIKGRIKEKFPKVGDLSSHPVNENMEKLRVKASGVVWIEPDEPGTRTEYSTR